ncbi:Os01g0681050 [Oryza sativa Japonica Group]|uniref:Os01g0681050 protein n=1 Tax=Oryza sativa subsp. japonica TaxID=39947 RepID=A0A0P0V6K2_ORYSJ|nr:hypothetical protein EE612_005010 [Oryza sativa]BAS73707.1 Os01g0681050 [Oryza sativa Japonica Group]
MLCPHLFSGNNTGTMLQNSVQPAHHLHVRTHPTAFLMFLTSSRLIVRFTKRLGRNSAPSSPLSTVRASPMSDAAVRVKQTTSTTVCHASTR